MDRLTPITTIADIPADYRNSPIGLLLESHNLDHTFEPFEAAELLIGMCMDHRKNLNIPNNFAYILRSGGANLRYSEFKVSYAIAVGGVRSIALIGHSQCGMVNLISKREQFIDGLVEGAGWDRERATEHFTHFAGMYEIGNAIDFVRSEAQCLRLRYPKVQVAPLFYRVEDNRLYGVSEE